MISSELAFFLSISIFLAVVVMFWLFRSWWGVLLPLVGVGLAMLWTFGLMAATGRPLDIIGELLFLILKKTKKYSLVSFKYKVYKCLNY